MKKYLYSDETLFRNRDLFEIDYIPEEFNYRESQLKDIAFALQPGLHGSRPLNMALRGLPGTGKTTARQKDLFRSRGNDPAPGPGLGELPD